MAESSEQKTLVIMPAYNEEQLISRTVAGIRGQVDHDILVVNDGSTDRTTEEARAAGALVLEHPINLGYGSTLQTGFIYALENDYDYVVQIDADGQHSAEFIAKLLEPVYRDEVDVAIGSRFMQGSYKASTVRRLGMIYFASLTSFLTKRKITDSTSGFQALNRRAMEFYASDSYPSDYPDADVIVMLHRRGYRFKEVPVVMYLSQTDQSMHSGIIRPMFYIFKMMLSIFVTLLRREGRV